MIAGRPTWPALLVVLLVPACATADRQGDPGVGLDAGALALRQARFAAARERLAAVRQICGDARLGRQALLLLSALELDPRNREGAPDLAAAFAARYLAHPETFPWTRPVAEQIYLQALRQGARPASAAADPLLEGGASPGPEACEQSDWALVAGAEPPALGKTAARGRPAQGTEGDESAGLRGRITELEAEIARIRATLEP